mmetsp:Transcript_10264/g.30648  ORF Transcript_10264/g.30648 Transcript_10264/m.30648 type:complete len:293 (-) Transcript_10264:218-1096(-)
MWFFAHSSAVPGASTRSAKAKGNSCRPAGSTCVGPRLPERERTACAPALREAVRLHVHVARAVGVGAEAAGSHARQHEDVRLRRRAAGGAEDGVVRHEPRGQGDRRARLAAAARGELTRRRQRIGDLVGGVDEGRDVHGNLGDGDGVVLCARHVLHGAHREAHGVRVTLRAQLARVHGNVHDAVAGRATERRVLADVVEQARAEEPAEDGVPHVLEYLAPDDGAAPDAAAVTLLQVASRLALEVHPQASEPQGSDGVDDYRSGDDLEAWRTRTSVSGCRNGAATVVALTSPA